MSNKSQLLLEFFFGPVDAERRQRFIQWFSLSILCYVCDRTRSLYEWLTAAGFHFSAESCPNYYPMVVPLLPVWGAILFFLVFVVALLLLVADWWPRTATWAVLAGVSYLMLADVITAFTINKLAVVVYLLQAVGPQPFEIVDEAGERRVESAWSLRILQATLVLHYFSAGWCKMWFGDWLTNPNVLWSQSQGFYCTEICAWLLRELPKSAFTVMQAIALGFEVGAPFLFVFRRWRPLGIFLGIAFHLGVAIMMYKLFYFSFQMITFYLLFTDEAWWQRGKELLQRYLPRISARRA